MNYIYTSKWSVLDKYIFIVREPIDFHLHARAFNTADIILCYNSQNIHEDEVQIYHQIKKGFTKLRVFRCISLSL